ncbi:MAG: diguanylate cyclase [Treponema sp.]|jgi:diguanylate cyclase (GGDEF)-like protein|nr:diguanylate cyclase [Treponema sp.]
MQGRLSIRLKVYSIAIGTALCIAMAVTGVSFFFSKQYILNTIENNMLFACGLANEFLSERIALLKRETDTLVAYLNNYSDEELQETLLKAALNGNWKDLKIVKRDGSMITFGSDPNVDGHSVRAVFDGQAVTSELGLSGDTSGFLLSIYAPIGDYVLVASSPDLSFSGLVKNFYTWNTGVFIIAQESGIIANAYPFLAVDHFDFNESFSQHIIKNDNGASVYTYEGIEYICAFHTIEGSNDWKLGIVSSLRENSAWRIQDILVLFGLGFLAFGILVAILVGKNIVHRVEKDQKAHKQNKESGIAESDAVSLLPTENEKLIKQLEKIDGLDVQGAIRMLGQKEGYYQILQQFCSSIDESIRILKISAKRGDWKAWTIRIHSLKSVLRTIGMKALGEEAARLEEAGKVEDVLVCRENMPTFCTSLKDLQEKLRKTDLSLPAPKTDANKIGIDALRDKLNALKYACNRHNVKEIETCLVDVRNISFNEAADKALNVICNLIDYFDYDEAVDKLDELLDFLQTSQIAEGRQSIDKEFSILAVDDEELNLTTLQIILGMEYTLFTACTGTDALQQLDERIPDLILLDILLPDMSGFELLEKLKSNPALAPIPVIIITGLNGEKEEERGLFLGAVDYITKPFNNAVVRARVKIHLRMISHIRAIERLGKIDPLTNIANRRSFDEHIQIEWKRSLREGGNIAFLMMDIDKFKNYNDTYGHPQGDALLKAVSHAIETSILRATDIVARLGGEEFGVILPETSLKDSLVVAERIRSKVEALQVPTADGLITKVTISIGVVSLVPTQAITIEEFISQADKNLYKAKEGGRNRVFWIEA